MLKEFMQNIPVLVITGIAAITSGTAVSKIATELNPLLANKGAEVREARTGSSDSALENGKDSQNLGDSTVNGGSGTTAANQVTIASAAQFTLATLAQHNKPGDCYVAYKSVVYNVSNHPSWQGCTHHGTSGGVDITRSFPHSTSYFNSLPKVGTLIGGTTGGGTGTARTDNDDDDREDDDRKESSKNDDYREENENEDNDD